VVHGHHHPAGVAETVAAVGLQVQEVAFRVVVEVLAEAEVVEAGDPK